MINVAEYNDLASLDGIRDSWRELWWKTRRASFFQSFEWFEASRRHLGEECPFRVLAVSAEGRTIGIVPLALNRVQTGLGRARVLTDALSPHGIFWGPLGPKPRLTLDAALTHLAESRRDWDVLELWQLDGHGLDRGRTPDAMRLNGFDPIGRTEERRAVVDCRGDWVRFWGSRSDAHRSEYRQCEAALARQGKIEYLRYRPEGSPLEEDDPRWQAFNEFESQSSSALNRSKLAVPALIRETHAAAARVAGLDFNVLTLSGRPIAWAYNYRCDGRIEMQQVHALAEFESIATTVLLGRILRDGFRRRDEFYLLDAETSRNEAGQMGNGWDTGRLTASRHAHFAQGVARSQAARFFRWLSRRVDGVETSSARGAVAPPHSASIAG